MTPDLVWRISHVTKFEGLLYESIGSPIDLNYTSILVQFNFMREEKVVRGLSIGEAWENSVRPNDDNT